MENSLLTILLLPILTAIIGSYFTYYFTNKSKKSEAILRFKEEKYSNLLILLQGFVGKTTSGETKRNFFEKQYKSWLYCSDGIVKAINEMVQLVIDSRGKEPEHEKGKKAVGNIVLEMRKDLLGKTELTADNFRYTDVIE
jgi:hypothetical protein